MRISKCCNAKMEYSVGCVPNISYCTKCGLCYHKVEKRLKPEEELDEWE